MSTIYYLDTSIIVIMTIMPMMPAVLVGAWP